MDRYQAIRDQIRTGDAFGVEGRGIIGTAIRVLTGQQLSHVALLINEGEKGGIWIAEFVEWKGYQKMPASHWIEKRKGSEQQLYWLEAPADVRGKHTAITAEANQYRPDNDNTDYSYFSLITVWISQLFRRKIPGAKVCSTFLQAIWEAAGYKKFKQSADPGDFMRHAARSTPLGPIQ